MQQHTQITSFFVSTFLNNESKTNVCNSDQTSNKCSPSTIITRKFLVFISPCFELWIEFTYFSLSIRFSILNYDKKNVFQMVFFVVAWFRSENKTSRPNRFNWKEIINFNIFQYFDTVLRNGIERIVQCFVGDTVNSMSLSMLGVQKQQRRKRGTHIIGPRVLSAECVP